MFRNNWLPSSGVQVVGEIAAPLSRRCTSHFKDGTVLKCILKLFLKYLAVIVLLYARVVGLVYL
jgi:hypothetical protein